MQKRQVSDIAAGDLNIRNHPTVQAHKAKGTAALIRFRTWLEF